jgi:hypothetical protein
VRQSMPVVARDGSLAGTGLGGLGGQGANLFYPTAPRVRRRAASVLKSKGASHG